MNHHRPASRFDAASTRGSSLVTTLLVIVVLTIIVTAFLQSMALERQTARSYMNRYRAQLAAEAGLEAFVSQLRSLELNGGETTSLVTSDPGDAPATVISKFDASGEITETTLVSQATTVPLGQLPAEVDLNRGSGGDSRFSNEETDTGDQIRYPADLVTYAEEGRSVFRYAFRAVDESGKINLAVHGSENDKEPRSPESPKEFEDGFPLSGLDPDSDWIPVNSTTDIRALSNDKKMTNALIGHFFNSRESFGNYKHLFTAHSGEFVPVIPLGYFNDSNDWVAYPDGGEQKFDINFQATDPSLGTPTERAMEISEIIDRNLPLFKERDRAFVLAGHSAQIRRYVDRIAANIVSYIDPVAIVTPLPDGEPAGRGLVAYPFKFCEKWVWVSTTGSANAWTVTFEHVVFVELWNPYTLPVSGTFEMTLTSQRPVQIPLAIQTPFAPVNGTINVANLQPNEIRVYRLGSRTQTFFVPSASQPLIATMDTTSSQPDADPNRWHSRFEASWNGSLFDFTPNESSPYFEESGPGLRKNSTTLRPSGGNQVMFSPNLRQVGPSGSTWEGRRRPVGDPRMGYWTNYVWESPSPTNAELRWNGRGIWNANSQFSQDFESLWTNRDTVRASPPIGRTRAAAQDPDAVGTNYSAAVHAEDAPFYVRGAAMESTAELGHIFDPAQLNDQGNYTNAATPSSYFSSGGARSLRIGQAEFNYPRASPQSSAEVAGANWDSNGRRAMMLLDLFTVVKRDNTDAISRDFGKININTAPRDVLAAIYYNLTLGSDEGLYAGDDPPVISRQGAYEIADAIIAGRPFRSSADLHRIADQFTKPSVFQPAIPTRPDSNSTAGAPKPPKIDAMDRAKEEIFRQAYEIFCYTSAAFKVVSLGLVSDQNGRNPAQATMEAIVELRASLDPNGKVTLNPVITHRNLQ